MATFRERWEKELEDRGSENPDKEIFYETAKVREIPRDVAEKVFEDLHGTFSLSGYEAALVSFGWNAIRDAAKQVGVESTKNYKNFLTSDEWKNLTTLSQEIERGGVLTPDGMKQLAPAILIRVMSSQLTEKLFNQDGIFKNTAKEFLNRAIDEGVLEGWTPPVAPEILGNLNAIFIPEFHQDPGSPFKSMLKDSPLMLSNLLLRIFDKNVSESKKHEAASSILERHFQFTSNSSTPPLFGKYPQLDELYAQSLQRNSRYKKDPFIMSRGWIKTLAKTHPELHSLFQTSNEVEQTEKEKFFGKPARNHEFLQCSSGKVLSNTLNSLSTLPKMNQIRSLLIQEIADRTVRYLRLATFPESAYDAKSRKDLTLKDQQVLVKMCQSILSGVATRILFISNVIEAKKSKPDSFLLQAFDLYLDKKFPTLAAWKNAFTEEGLMYLDQKIIGENPVIPISVLVGRIPEIGASIFNELKSDNPFVAMSPLQSLLSSDPHLTINPFIAQEHAGDGS
ncbi:MAG TPA: hypothetical protein VIY47_08235, partial [Ignavibacteriaceae bacterium]